MELAVTESSDAWLTAPSRTSFARKLGKSSPRRFAGFVPQRTFSGLQLIFPPSNFSSATPVKRRGKSMSRRTGQTGHIEKSGKWWVVRWWMDVPGQEKRVLKRAKICPIAGPGALSASERKRRGREIIAKSGADTVEYFNKVVKGQHAQMSSHSKSKRSAGSNICENVNVNPLLRAQSRIGSGR